MIGQKIIVIGCSGAGKSTFARALAEKTGLPLCHLDLIWHRADKTHITREEFDEQLRDWLARPQWIIDGDFSRTLDLRAEACDTIVFLDYPMEVCLAGVASRVGKVRPDMPWIEEEFDPDFRDWILAFPKERLPQIQSVIERYKAEKHILIFSSRDEAAAFLETL